MTMDDEFKRAKANHVEYVFAYGYLRSAVDAALDFLGSGKDGDAQRAYGRLNDGSDIEPLRAGCG